MANIGDETVKYGKTFVLTAGGKWELKPSATSTLTKQTEILTELDKKANKNETQPVSLSSSSSLPLSDGAATEAKQLPDNHNVTVSNQISTTGLATEAKQLADNHNVTVSNQISTSGLATEAKQLADNHQVTVSNQISVTDLATKAKQDSQIALETTLNNLITTLNNLVETNNILTQRLEVIASMANSGAPALRTIPIGSVSTAVTGSVTATVASTSITNFGTGIPASEMAHDINNFTAIVANINNVVVSP